MNIQVDREHYNFLSYVDSRRWESYYYQVKEILAYAKNDILIIGKGDGIVSSFCKNICPTLQLKTADFDESLKPDICTDVLVLSKHIDIMQKPDTIVCCQVLEHLPFDNFETAVIEIYKSIDSQGTFILSLPDSGCKIGFRVDFPKFHHTVSCKILKFWKTDFRFNGEHYWEINSARKYSVKKIRTIIEKYFEILKEYNVPNNDYHRFYILKPIRSEKTNND